MRRLSTRLAPILSLAVVVALLGFFGTLLATPGHPFSIGALGSVQFVLNTNAAALTSAMSVLIALVLLTVQLTAQRYSFNIIGIFIQDRVNAILVGLFIVTITYNLWLGLILKEEYIPAEAVILAMILMTICFALLPAYVVYLFDIVRPDHILNHLQHQFRKATVSARRAGRTASCRAVATRRLAQIGDIARTAVSLSDGAVARHSVWVLYWSIAAYVEEKTRLPSDWFAVEEQQFRGRHELIVREIEETMTWVERRMLDEVREVFYATLNKMHDVNNTVALVLRLLGERAVETDDDGLFLTVVKFFNTFLRATINQGDVRSGYHVLYQYRLLADTAMDRRPELALEIADRISYYGDAAASGPLLWMSAAAAYDLRVLAENVHGRGLDASITRAVVDNLLDTVRRGEAKTSPALPELYKMVIALGAYFFAHGERDLAMLLRGSVAHVPPDRLDRCARELGGVDDPVFWELTDRVVNFDFVEEQVRAAIPAFIAGQAIEPALPDGTSAPANGEASLSDSEPAQANGANFPPPATRGVAPARSS